MCAKSIFECKGFDNLESEVFYFDHAPSMDANSGKPLK